MILRAALREPDSSYHDLVHCSSCRLHLAGHPNRRV